MPSGLAQIAPPLPEHAPRRGVAWLERVGVDLLVWVGVALIGVPLLLTLYLSLFDEKLILFPPHGYTLSWYAAILPNFGDPIVTSLELAAAAVCGSLLLGVPAGIGLSRHRFRGRGLVSTLLLAPLTVPGIALGLAVYVMLVTIDEQFGSMITGSLIGLVLAHVLITTPWVVRLCLAALTNHERSAEEAAASLGANPLTVIWRVTLPAMRPGIIAGALFAFVISFENLEPALFLSSPGVTTLPVAVLQYLEYHIDPLVSALAVAQTVGVAALLLLLDRFMRLGRVVPMNHSAALSLRGLTRHYGAHAAVQDVTLDVQPGELIVLLGPSGCGKTTTLRLIAGFVSPSAGDILLDGRSIAALPPHRREMGIVFQSYALFPHLSVARNVAFGLEMRRTPAATAAARVAEMLRLVKLEAMAARLPRELSGGQQQRVALARALAIHPRLLLLDEPLSNLDAALRGEMAREIRILQRNGGITSIMVTHDQTEAMAMADRLVVMHDGRVQQIGTPETIHAAPANPFVARFIGGSNILAGGLSDGRHLVLPDGTTLTLAGRYAGSGASTLTVRPDSVHLLPPGSDARAPDARSWSARAAGEVTLCTWLGSVVEHVVQLGPDTTVLTRGAALGRDAVRRHAPGTPVELSWEPDEERLFDADGNALAPSITVKETNDA